MPARKEAPRSRAAYINKVLRDLEARVEKLEAAIPDWKKDEKPEIPKDRRR